VQFRFNDFSVGADEFSFKVVQHLLNVKAIRETSFLFKFRFERCVFKFQVHVTPNLSLFIKVLFVID